MSLIRMYMKVLNAIIHEYFPPYPTREFIWGARAIFALRIWYNAFAEK